MIYLYLQSREHYQGQKKLRKFNFRKAFQSYIEDYRLHEEKQAVIFRPAGWHWAKKNRK